MFFGLLKYLSKGVHTFFSDRANTAPEEEREDKEGDPGILTQNVMAQFTQITKSALNQFIKDRVDERLKTALETQEEEEEKPPVDVGKPPNGEIETTEEEWKGFISLDLSSVK